MTVTILAAVSLLVWLVSVLELKVERQLHHGWVLVLCFLPLPDDVRWVLFLIGNDDTLAHFVDAFVFPGRGYLGPGHHILEWIARKVKNA